MEQLLIRAAPPLPTRGARVRPMFKNCGTIVKTYIFLLYHKMSEDEFMINEIMNYELR